ncbi:kinesin-like protein KIF20A [Nephila pilipes]|uniref:Kinesin-like protein KIF20A n=1 Tax=Nephila pilipes TaxID=299642 RepID=A0A8X6PRF2_NEPPI|nr:kinesin-like protein KIF20A [Nephila pilipes]
MSFSPGNEGNESPDKKFPRVTMCLDTMFLNTQDGTKSENMKVYARVRPMLQKEEDEGYRECIAAIDEEVVRAIVPITSTKFKNSAQNCQDVYDFKYTQAFGPEIGQFVFFEQTIMDIMQGFIEGQNCLIFNYGITNSGKTFTLQGDENNPGIIPLAMHLFFGSTEHQLMDGLSVKPEKFSDIIVLKDNEKVQELRLKEELLKISDQESFSKTNATESPNSLEKSFAQILCDCFRDDFKYHTETTLPPEEMMAAQSALYMREVSKKSADQQPGHCNVWVSFIEIYNEYIYDLLQPNITQRAKLSLAEDQNGDVYVKGAREIYVSNSTEAVKLLNVGRRNLRIASTKLNYQSSRSHCIFTVKVARVYDDDNGTTGRVNRISFCDLAGSERATKSQASGMRLKEAGYINTSLMVLGRCLDQLRLNQTARDKKMIPFRESKLTRLFSNHFLGKGKAVMIANASPCEYTFDETLNVLRFSALAKDLTINDSYISMTSSSLQDLTNQWMVSKGRLSEAPQDQSMVIDSDIMEHLQERDEVIEKLIDLADSLKNNLELEKKEKLELEVKIRQDVCNEYAEYSDQLLDKQKKNFEDQIQSIKELYQKRLEEMEAMYEKREKDLKAEYEASSDESFESSMNKTNVDDNAAEKLINFSPVVNLPVKQEIAEIEKNTSISMNTSMDCFETINEDKDYKNIPDVQSLRKELEAVTNELKTVKEKLTQTNQSLQEVRIEEGIAKENCDSLNCKLLEANQVLEEYQKELDLLKSTSVMNDSEIESLLEEKKNLQDNILSLSDKLAFVTTEMEHLQKDNIELKERSQELTEAKKNIADLEEEIRGLSSELKETVETLKDEKEKFNKLEKEISNYKNGRIIKTEDFDDLKQKFDLISDQLDKSAAENETLKKEKLEMEENYTKEKMQVIEEINDLEQKCKELSAQLEECTQTYIKEKSNFESLQTDFENHKNNHKSALEDLNNLKEKYTDISEEFGLATTKIELLKKEKLIAEADYDQEKTKLLNEMAQVEEKCKELSMKSENLTHAAVTEKSKFDAMEAEYENCKNRISTLIQDQEKSNEKFALISKQLDAATVTIEDLQREKFQADKKFTEGNSELLEQWKNTEASLKEANQDIEEHKSKICELDIKVAELESACASYKRENAELVQKFQDLQEKFTQVSEFGKAGDEKCKELNLALEKMIENLEEKKLKVADLESKCSVHETENANLLQTLKDFEEKSALLSEQMEQRKSLSSSLEEANNKIEKQKLKIEELESTCSTYKIDNSELINELKDLQEKLTVVSEELIVAKAEDVKAKELSKELESITQALVEEKSKIDELVSKCSTYEVENAKLLQNIKDSEEQGTVSEQTISYSDKIEKLTSRLEEVTQQLEDRNSKINRLEEECSCLKSESSELLNNFNAEKEKFAQLSEEHDLAVFEVNHLQKEIAETLDAHSKALADLKTNEAATQEKYDDLCMKIKESSEIIEVQKARMTQLENENTKYARENLDLSENLKTLDEKHVALSETYAPLLQILEKCELCATHKIKFLHSSSIKNLEQMTDMNRQIKEKETSIEELERALCDSQKQLKESEAKAKKQLITLKQQHTIEIEELVHLKKLVEEENKKLKLDITEVKEKTVEIQEEKDDRVMKRSTSNASKGRKKRSLSDVSKRENDNSQNKENSDQEVTDKKVKDNAENKIPPKRRRVLRQKQDVIEIDTDSHVDSDEEYKPIKTNMRKRVPLKDQKSIQKKLAVQEPKVPATRISRKKLQEEVENVSPVKKAMAFVGSKIRSVAQTVSNMPSPRITRGRKKLFNADAPSTPSERKWKY